MYYDPILDKKTKAKRNCLDDSELLSIVFRHFP